MAFFFLFCELIVIIDHRWIIIMFSRIFFFVKKLALSKLNQRFFYFLLLWFFKFTYLSHWDQLVTRLGRFSSNPDGCDCWLFCGSLFLFGAPICVLTSFRLVVNFLQKIRNWYLLLIYIKNIHNYLEIKPCGLGSRIQDMDAESYNWFHLLVIFYFFWYLTGGI